MPNDVDVRERERSEVEFEDPRGSQEIEHYREETPKATTSARMSQLKTVPTVEAPAMLEYSEDLGELLTGLVEATLKFEEIDRDLEATVTSRKEGARGYTYRYASLQEINKAIRKPLAENGLVVMHGARPMRGDGQNVSVRVRTTLFHTSGQWVRTDLQVGIFGSDPQNIGIGISYAKRYNILALLNLSPGDEDDNDGANPAERTQVQAAPRKSEEAKREAAPREEARSEAPVQAAITLTSGCVKSVESKGDGLLVVLDNGFRAATKNQDLMRAIRAYEKTPKTTVEVESRPSTVDPKKYVPSLLSIRAKREGRA